METEHTENGDWKVEVTPETGHQKPAAAHESNEITSSEQSQSRTWWRRRWIQRATLWLRAAAAEVTEGQGHGNRSNTCHRQCRSLAGTVPASLVHHQQCKGVGTGQCRRRV